MDGTSSRGVGRYLGQRISSFPQVGLITVFRNDPKSSISHVISTLTSVPPLYIFSSRQTFDPSFPQVLSLDKNVADLSDGLVYRISRIDRPSRDHAAVDVVGG